MLKNTLKLSHVFYALALVLLSVVFFKYWDIVVYSISGHILILLYIIPLYLLAIIVQANNYLKLLDLSIALSIVMTTQVWAVSNLVNYLGPFQPGLLVRMIFFKKNGISLAKSSFTSLKQVAISLWIALLLFTIFAPLTQLSELRILAFFSALIFFLIPVFEKSIVYFLVIILKRKGLELNNWEKLKIFSFKKLPQYYLFFINYLLICLSLWFVYDDFGANISVAEVVILTVTLVFSTLVTITPNNVGVQEVLLGYASHVGGLSGGEAVTIALLFRIAQIASCLLIVVITKWIIWISEKDLRMNKE